MPEPEQAQNCPSTARVELQALPRSMDLREGGSSRGWPGNYDLLEHWSRGGSFLPTSGGNCRGLSLNTRPRRAGDSTDGAVLSPLGDSCSPRFLQHSSSPEGGKAPKGPVWALNPPGKPGAPRFHLLLLPGGASLKPSDPSASRSCSQPPLHSQSSFSVRQRKFAGLEQPFAVNSVKPLQVIGTGGTPSTAGVPGLCLEPCGHGAADTVQCPGQLKMKRK